MPDVIALIGSEVSLIQNFMAGLSTAEWSRPSALCRLGGWRCLCAYHAERCYLA